PFPCRCSRHAQSRLVTLNKMRAPPPKPLVITFTTLPPGDQPGHARITHSSRRSRTKANQSTNPSFHQSTNPDPVSQSRSHPVAPSRTKKNTPPSQTRGVRTKFCHDVALSANWSGIARSLAVAAGSLEWISKMNSTFNVAFTADFYDRAGRPKYNDIGLS